MSDGNHDEPLAGADYVAPVSANGRTRRFWIVSVGALVLVIAGTTTVAIALGSSGSKPNNVMTLDSVADRTPVTEANSTTTEPPTTRVIDTAIPNTSIAVSETVSATDPPAAGSSTPKDLPLRATLRVTSATQMVAGELSSYTLTVANPGEVDKPIRVISGWDDSDHAGTNAGVTVSGCAPPAISQNAKYFAFEAMLPAGAVCTVRFDVSTNPNYFGRVKFSFTLAGDYDHTETYWFAPAVTTIRPEITTSAASTRSAVSVPGTTPPSIA